MQAAAERIKEDSINNGSIMAQDGATTGTLHLGGAREVGVRLVRYYYYDSMIKKYGDYCVRMMGSTIVVVVAMSHA